MGLGVLKLFFNVLSWPSFSMLYPLYASIRAIESGSCSKNQRCLAYWVLFSMTTILELVLAKLLQWLPFWPYVKGISNFLLAMFCFEGASYIYKHFVRPYITGDSKFCVNFLFPRETGFTLSDQNSFLDAAERYIDENGSEELKKLITSQAKSEPNNGTTDGDGTRSISPLKVQKEWSCALCLVSTTSEECLRDHIQGKKHKAKEEELKANELCLMPNRTKGMVLLENFNQILNIQKWRWCRWQKPQFPWIKLNTDGSIDRENAGYGGLLRDFKGDPICAYVCKAPRLDIFLLELWAVWRGLVLAVGLGIKLLWVESDSMSVVKTINREQPYSLKAGSSLRSIWALLKKFKKYRVSHSWRQTNRAADYLSKLVLTRNDVVLKPIDFPIQLHNIIRDDARGRWYHRA